MPQDINLDYAIFSLCHLEKATLFDKLEEA